MSLTQNPLVNLKGLPPFSKIKPEHMYPALENAINICKAEVERVLLNNTNPTWDNFIAPIEQVNDDLNRLFSPIGHMNSVVNSPLLRDAYEACLPMLSEYGTWMGQHKGLYHAYEAIKAGDTFNNLNQSQKKSITNALRDFKLSGIGLDDDKQKLFGKISKELSSLSSEFSNNVLDATMGWTKHITDVNDLAGMPESAISAAAAEAKSKNLDGYLLTLTMPSYIPVLSYCDNQDIREQMYKAYITRASELGPNAGTHDNTDVIKQILKLRHQHASLLGFNNHAEKSLATKMAQSTTQVLDFLNDLAVRVKPQGQNELDELRAFAKKEFAVTELNLWDIPYYSEKYKQHLFNFSDEDIRPYFPEDKVISGLFEVLNRLYDLKITEKQGVDTWHESVRFFEIFDKTNTLRGSFYLDLYAREHKRGGAWMDDCITRRISSSGQLQNPVAYLTCNFSKPVDGKPAMFTHDEVITLFHETGHGLHHMLTKIETGDVSGINGVPWDAVELPSQFLENWCWQEEALEFISGHYKTGESLPKQMQEKMLAAKNYNSGLFILRQLKQGLFDFTLHTNYDDSKEVDLAKTLADIDANVSVTQSLNEDRFYNGFGHIFSSGYSAGYYSYLWAELLSADAFSRFEEEGIFNKQTGQDFLNNVLEMGGSEEPMELFKRFRGREPKIDAMLKSYGIK